MAKFTSQDLRSLADMLDALGEATRDTGVAVTSYSGEHVTLNDHMIVLIWEGPDGDAPGRYLVDYPDGI